MVFPAFWEVETLILGEIVGISDKALSAEVETKYLTFRIDERKREIFDLMDQREEFWRGAEKKAKTRKRRSLLNHEQNGIEHRDSGSAKEARPSPRDQNPLMQVIEKYRLPAEAREKIIRTVLRDNIERWWTKYQAYKKAKVRFREQWEAWRLDVMALGPHNRELWPKYPPMPQFPYTLMHVDKTRLRKRVFAELKQSKTGQLL